MFIRNKKGFTLVELLIGILMASVVSYAAMSLYITQHKQMIVQDQVADLQGSVRAATEVIAKAARSAGYNVAGPVTAIETYDTNPDTIVLTYDSGGLEDVQLEFGMPQVSAELRCDGHDLSGLNDNEWIYIYDPAADFGEFLLVTQVQYGSSNIQHNTMPLSMLYPAGSQVTKMTRVKFFIDQSDPEHPNLMIQNFGSNPEVFAENITDLNFRYFMKNGSIVTQTASPNDIRMVEIDVVGRTDSPDDEFANDYRTRNFNLRVKVRNLDL